MPVDDTQAVEKFLSENFDIVYQTLTIFCFGETLPEKNEKYIRKIISKIANFLTIDIENKIETIFNDVKNVLLSKNTILT